VHDGAAALHGASAARDEGENSERTNIEPHRMLFIGSQRLRRVEELEV
jgi:hypothetical protein